MPVCLSRWNFKMNARIAEMEWKQPRFQEQTADTEIFCHALTPLPKMFNIHTAAIGNTYRPYFFW